MFFSYGMAIFFKIEVIVCTQYVFYIMYYLMALVHTLIFKKTTIPSV